MCAVSLQTRESPPTPRRLAQGVLITHTDTPRESPPTPRKLAQGVLITRSKTPRTVCSPSSFSHEPWKRWTFCESRHVGSGLGVTGSSRVPGKFWTLMWALMACLQR